MPRLRQTLNFKTYTRDNWGKPVIDDKGSFVCSELPDATVQALAAPCFYIKEAAQLAVSSGCLITDVRMAGDE